MHLNCLFSEHGANSLCRILIKTEDYLDLFARFKVKENVGAVENILMKSNLQPFERSQLGISLTPLNRNSPPSEYCLEAIYDLRGLLMSRQGTLCCETAEEAKTLIPSIANKISDEELQNLLDDISKLRSFVE